MKYDSELRNKELFKILVIVEREAWEEWFGWTCGILDWILCKRIECCETQKLEIQWKSKAS
jgi:hypothetical protein